MKTNKNKKGFTLVELLIVIAILAILATVSIVGYNSYIGKAKQSTYLQYAKANFDKYYADRLGDIEDGTYVFVEDKSEEDNGGWFKYSNGELVSIDGKPAEASYYYQLDNLENSIYLDEDADYLDENTHIVKPTTKLVVDRLNSLLEGSATTYETLADVGKTITDDEMNAINYGAIKQKYRIVYSLTENQLYIANNDLTEILYSSDGTTTVPSDKRIVTGANINTAEDLVKFSKVTNKSPNKIKPDYNNIFIVENPIVICNILNNITINSNDKYIPLANWYIYGTDGYCKDYYDIHLLLNGNNRIIGTLTSDGFIGGLKAGSVIRDITINYAIGSQENYTALDSSFDDHLSKYEGYGIWHTGLLIKYIHQFSNSSMITISNVDMNGQVYLGGSEDKGVCNTLGIVIGCFANQNNDTITLTITDSNFFSRENDHVYAKSGKVGEDRNGFLTGLCNYYTGNTNEEKFPKGLSISNCTFNKDIETNLRDNNFNKMYGKDGDNIVWNH